MVGLPPLVDGEMQSRLPFAVGCGFAGGGLRELCPKEAIWHFSPFVFTSLPRRAWQMLRTLQVDWQVVLLLAPIALELLRQALGPRWSEHHRLFVLSPARRSLDDRSSSCSRRCSRVATPIKIWNNARIEHRLQEQEKLLLAAKIEALANQINPHFLFNTLDVDLVAHPHAARNGAHADHQALGPAAAADAQHRSLRDAARGARIDRRVPRHRGRALRPPAQGRQAHQRPTRSTSSCPA